MAAMTVWEALNGGIPFTMDSMRILNRVGRLPPTLLQSVGGAPAPLPDQEEDESNKDFEYRVKIYADKYFKKFYVPLFRPYLKGSLVYEMNDTIQMLLNCLDDDPNKRPSSKNMVDYLNTLQKNILK